MTLTYRIALGLGDPEIPKYHRDRQQIGVARKQEGYDCHQGTRRPVLTKAHKQQRAQIKGDTIPLSDSSSPNLPSPPAKKHRISADKAIVIASNLVG
jgi:hypothetical protein